MLQDFIPKASDGKVSFVQQLPYRSVYGVCGWVLLAARVGERDRIGPQACRTQGQQHRRGVHPGTEANHDQLAQERGTQGAALACID